MLIAMPKKETKSLEKIRGAFLVEMFSAIQGEGTIVGQRQIFVRFLGCHIACAYCDTPDTHIKLSQCRIEKTPGKRDFELWDNPVPLEKLASRIAQLDLQPIHDGISLTGGEPLQHIKTLKQLIPLLPQHLPIYLETDGILYSNLAKIIEHIDLIGMDIKLPTATGLKSYWEEHRQFIEMANQKDVFVKVVLTQETPTQEVQQAIDIVASCNPKIPFILQPVTPYGKVRNPPLPEQLLNWQALAKQSLQRVLAIPQTHKIMGQL